MEKVKPALLILAAGIGSRYGGLKQLDRIGPSGETVLDYSIYDAVRSGFGKVVFIIKEEIEREFRQAVIDRLRNHIDAGYVFQEIRKIPEGTTYSAERQKPWGTGHAVLMAAGTIDTPFAVINSDDFYGRDAYGAIARFYSNREPGMEDKYCMVGYPVGLTLSEFGTVSRGVCQAGEGNFLEDVVERTRIERDGDTIKYTDEEGKRVSLPGSAIVSMNCWGFTPSFFGHLDKEFREFIGRNAQDPKAEFYIPSVVNGLIKSGKASVRILPTSDRWFGMTYKEDRETVVRSIRELVDRGIYPERLWI